MNRLRPNLFLVVSALFFAGAVAWRVTRPPETRAHGPGEVLAVGESVPGFWRDLGMQQEPRGPVLVTFLTAECPWCRITVPRWNALDGAVRQIRGGTAVAVALSAPDSIRTYSAQTGLRIPLHLSADSTVERRWKVAAVPYTLLMEPSGRVAAVWRGALTDDDRDQAVATIRRWKPAHR
jgi:peroxiredoxin